MDRPEPTAEEIEQAEKDEMEQIADEEAWHDARVSLYTWDEGGFCDGFTKY